eukprot:scaffold35514_cov137-Amphora_coffeaeformis.AAC.1
MIKVTLAPLFNCSSVAEIYEKQALLQEFVETLPTSAFSKMINWAKSKEGNRILELQFQGFLLGELHEYFMVDHGAVQPTQEDKLESGGRTDIRMRTKETLLILELKQKPNVPPTKLEMDAYHKQLAAYVEEIFAKEQILVA